MMKLSLILPKGWQKQKTEALPSSEMNKESSVLPQNQVNRSNITLHRSCKTLPVSAFKYAYCNGDFTGLGTGTAEELAEAWSEILFDWGGLIKTEGSEHLFDLAKTIAILQAHVLLVEHSVHYLKNLEWDEDIANALRAEGYNTDNLDMVLSLAKRKVYDLNEAQDEYDRLTKTVGGKKITEEEFDENVEMLIKWRGVTIDQDTTTVKAYASILNLYLKQNKKKQT